MNKETTDVIYEIQKQDGTIGYWTDYQIKQHMRLMRISSKSYMIKAYYGKVLRKQSVPFLVVYRQTDDECMSSIKFK